jgi:hypothetical protein
MDAQIPNYLPDADTNPGCVLRPRSASFPPLAAISPVVVGIGAPISHGAAVTGQRITVVPSDGGLETRRLFMSGCIVCDAGDAAHDHTAFGAVVRAVQRRDCSASSWIPGEVSVTPLNCSHDGITLSTHKHSMRGGMSNHLTGGTCPRIEVLHKEVHLSQPSTAARRRVPIMGHPGALRYFAYEEIDVMQHERLATTVVAAVEEWEDCWKGAISDGELTPSEVDDLSTRKRNVVLLASENDEAIAMTVTMLRCGPESSWLRRQMRERSQRRRSTPRGSVKRRLVATGIRIVAPQNARPA